MHQAVDLLSGDVDVHGRLVLASGKPQGQLSIDSGLYSRIWPLHQKSSAAGTACHVSCRDCWTTAVSQSCCRHPTAALQGPVCCVTCLPGVLAALAQAATTFVSSARWEVDVYRKTHLLPFVPFFKLSVLARSLLRQVSHQARCAADQSFCLPLKWRPNGGQSLLRCSATSMLLYPLQSGTLNAALCHHHREQLLAVATAFQACCSAVAGSLESNEPIGHALQARKDGAKGGQTTGRSASDMSACASFGTWCRPWSSCTSNSCAWERQLPAPQMSSGQSRAP